MLLITMFLYDCKLTIKFMVLMLLFSYKYYENLFVILTNKQKGIQNKEEME